MSRPSTSIALLAMIGLLGLQLSGLHLHVSAEGLFDAPHVAHSHVGDDGHEHDGDKDVSLLELSVPSPKLLVFLVAAGVAVLILFERGARVPTELLAPSTYRRRARLRPPLRAPPHLRIPR